MNFRHLAIGVIGIFVIFIQSCDTNKNTGEFEPYQMYNARAPQDNLVTAGQPSVEDFERLAKRGVKRVINLRSKKEMKGFDEASIVKKLGMEYIWIPIDGSKEITLETVKKLDAAMDGLKQPVLVHCASSNRVGGMLAYREFALKNVPADKALALGRSAGMRSTEKRVKKLMGL